MNKERLIVIVGPTACGKTAFATSLALQTDGEILSGDSRQVYRGMDIGTGKDLSDYTIDGHKIPYHLIDIAAPGEKYNVYRYQQDFAEAYADVTARGKQPILCGGSGLYIEAVIKNYSLLSAPPNTALRAELEGKTMDELAQILASYQPLHNTTDLDNRRRTTRAIEIADYLKSHPEGCGPMAGLRYAVIGLDIPRELRRERITRRLRARLREGMVDEIRKLLDSGVRPEDLIYYGLEYKYVTLYCTGQISMDEMTEQLEIAIHQFAKRQMTWFRGMERRGVKINWIDASQPIDAMTAQATAILSDNE
ncbi:MAG: tRNA (adenosine(37)-N6)-dimethylallyltransferase MiaA [Marinilabiliaceae bacterium]